MSQYIAYLSLSLSAMNSNCSQTICYDTHSLVYLETRVFVEILFSHISSVKRK